MADPNAPSWMVEPAPPSSSYATTSGAALNHDESTPSWLTPDVGEAGSGSSGSQRQHPQQTLEISTGVEESPDSNVTAPRPSSNAEAAAAKTWGQYFRESFKRDGRLILITVLIVIIMNIPILKWIVYPFTIFSTWIHELCHGLAAVLSGGSISKIEIFPDTSGLAYTSSQHRGFVASAGYQGTPVIGCLLLIFRRTKRGPRSGTMALAVMMILSVMLWIRNVFGICFILLLGILLGIVAWKLPSFHMRNVYVALSVTCSLNAITSIRNLYGSTHMVNGEETSTDAHTMADLKGGNAAMWATIWLVLALVLTVCGVLFAIPGPDEVADFKLCGVCQDLGFFGLCNLKGQRLWSRMFGKTDNDNNKDHAIDDAEAGNAGSN